MVAKRASKRVVAIAAAVAGVLTLAPAPAGAQLTPTTPVAGLPSLMTPFANINDAYNKAANNLKEDVTSDGGFNAGERWPQAWTRDTSYSSDLGVNLTYPQIATATLKNRTETVKVAGTDETVWHQDVSGHFQGWPNETDAIVGAVGSWSLYLSGGDTSYLKTAYEATQGTLKRAETDVRDASSGLFKGCSSFMESKSAYPASYWDGSFDSAGAKTEALSTNVLYYRGYLIAAQMAKALGKPQSDIDAYNTKAQKLKTAINTKLWNAARGYYAYYLDENGKQSDRMEGLGEALAILWGVATPTQAAQIRTNVPKISNYPGAAIPGFPTAGYPVLWPQYKDWVGNIPDLSSGDNKHDTAQYYHDGMIWPFVQGYWGIAAATQRDADTFSAELRKMLALSGTTTNYTYADNSVSPDNSFHEFYQPDGTVDGSARQLWSAAAYLAMIYQGLFGITLTPDGVQFNPVLPANFNDATSTLKNLKSRNATLNITIHGAGTQIKTFKLDDQAQNTPTIANNLTGTHTIDITMAGSQSGPVKAANGSCLDVTNAATSDGAPIQTYPCNGTPAQQITIATDGTLRVLGKCIDVAGSRTANNTPVQLYHCNGTGAQQWSPRAKGQLVNPQSGRCLSVTNSPQLQIMDCGTPGIAQVWTLPPPR